MFFFTACTINTSQSETKALQTEIPALQEKVDRNYEEQGNMFKVQISFWKLNNETACCPCGGTPLFQDVGRFPKYLLKNIDL